MKTASFHHLRSAALIGILLLPVLAPVASAGESFAGAIADVIDTFQRVADFLPLGSKEKRMVAKFFKPMEKKLDQAVDAFEDGKLAAAAGKVGGVVKKLEKTGILVGILRSEVSDVNEAVVDSLESQLKAVNRDLGRLGEESRQAAKLRAKIARAQGRAQQAREEFFGDNHRAFYKAAKSAAGMLGKVARKLERMLASSR